MQGGDRIANRHADAHRNPAGLRRQVAQSPHRFADHAKPGPVAIRSGLAVTGDPDHHETRIGLGSSVSYPRFQCSSVPGLKFSTTTSARDASVRTSAWPSACRRSMCDGFLVPRLDVPPERRAVPEQTPVAERVSGAGRFDLDHVGAEVPQQPATERAGDQLTELEDPNAAQRGRAAALRQATSWPSFYL